MAASLRTSGHNASSSTTLDVALTGLQAGDLITAWYRHGQRVERAVGRATRYRHEVGAM